ncbi:MAG: ribonuclease HII [Bacteroidales bacterium]|nr:ribonuclease HII [Bacteroidales bacterium]
MKHTLRLFLEAGRVEAGCDEAGRGCLAGPVVAAAVILPAGFENAELDDSKKLTEAQRYSLRPLIEQTAVAYAVAIADHREIDDINILNASILAMHRAVEKLHVIPEHLLIDGNRFKPYPNIGHTCIIKGDALFLPIAAASVLAKTYRDDLMSGYHQQFPAYGWDKNKGYPTKEHRQAIRRYGVSPLHRLSFHLREQEKQLQFEF